MLSRKLRVDSRRMHKCQSRPSSTYFPEPGSGSKTDYLHRAEEASATARLDKLRELRDAAEAHENSTKTHKVSPS